MDNVCMKFHQPGSFDNVKVIPISLPLAKAVSTKITINGINGHFSIHFLFSYNTQRNIQILQKIFFYIIYTFLFAYNTVVWLSQFLLWQPAIEL